MRGPTSKGATEGGRRRGSAQILAVVPPMSKASTSVQPQRPRQVRGQDRAAGRAGFDQADREARGRLEGGEAAAGHHQQQRAGRPALRQVLCAGGAGSRPSAAHIGVGDGGGEALVLADLGADLAATGRWSPRPSTAAGSRGRRSCRRDIGVQEADGHGFDAGRAHRRRRRGARRLVQHLQQHAAVGRDALAHREAQRARHQRPACSMQRSYCRSASRSPSPARRGSLRW
jgi:hypothetical protein